MSFWRIMILLRHTFRVFAQRYLDHRDFRSISSGRNHLLDLCCSKRKKPRSDWSYKSGTKHQTFMTARQEPLCPTQQVSYSDRLFVSLIDTEAVTQLHVEKSVVTPQRQNSQHAWASNSCSKRRTCLLTSLLFKRRSRPQHMRDFDFFFEYFAPRPDAPHRGFREAFCIHDSQRILAMNMLPFRYRFCSECCLRFHSIKVFSQLLINSTPDPANRGERRKPVWPGGFI